MTTVVFSHGQESGPWGTKIRAMAERVKSLGCQAESIDYRGIEEPAARIRKLVQECAQIDDKRVLVGSSMGGYVATAAAEEVGAIGLFVLAPAYYMEGYDAPTPPPPRLPICIVHGWHDEIVPAENSIRYAGTCSATLHLVDGDHRLTANIDEINEYLSYFINRTSE
ncbi:MAG: alpha/beta hydrolase [Woeseiaceae bacterium]|nr:alpha/beta hydrolase [Woeseiaceae bacterium]